MNRIYRESRIIRPRGETHNRKQRKKKKKKKKTKKRQRQSTFTEACRSLISAISFTRIDLAARDSRARERRFGPALKARLSRSQAMASQSIRIITKE